MTDCISAQHCSSDGLELHNQARIQHNIKESHIDKSRISAAFVFGLLFCAGLALLGMTLSQGQFSISDRDNNTSYIKKVRVVSTLTYYLSD